MFNCK